MATRVSNCGHDERGRYSGGSAGDQSGTEWRLMDWYYFRQNVVLRHPDVKVRRMIAEMATAAANNNNIGYDQGQRETFWQQLQRCGYNPANISTKCEADCSSGVAAIVKGAGYRLGMDKLKAVSPSVYTGNEKAALLAAGFTALTGSKYTQSGDYLLAGDINLNESMHTNITVTNGRYAGSEGGSGGGSTGKLEVDGYWGRATTTELQKTFGTYVDGEVWHQWPSNRRDWMTSGWKYDYTETGSPLIRAMQRWLNGKGHNAGEVDGLVGNLFWTALAKELGVSGGLNIVKEMQRRLNNGKLK